jgi:phosphate transport system substrate-binding protein
MRSGLQSEGAEAMPNRKSTTRAVAAGIRVTAAMLAVIGAVSGATADPLTIQGSTTFNRRLMEPHQAEIEAVTGHQLTVIPNKSTPGLIALLEGRAHMAMISAPLETEIALVRKVMPGLPFEKLRAFEIDRTRVSFAVNRANPVRAATLDQIADIMLGKITNWNALGGPDLPIRVVLVGGGGGLTVAVESGLLGGRELLAPNKIYVNTPVQLIQVVGQERGAIGFAQLALVQKMKSPELKTDKPFEQVLYLVTFGEPTPAMHSVIDAAKAIAARSL